MKRREFLGSGMLALPGAEPGGPKLKVVCVGAHPDDPESGCGGTLARYSQAGHRVTIIYLTRGERGVRGKSYEDAAAIRSAEAEAACKILGAKPVFAGQINGAAELNDARAGQLTKLVLAEEPDVVFTHWPIDTHMDHQIASVLTFRAYLASPRRFPLYFFEVNAGSQTVGFQPTDYVDITPVREKKKAALFAHKSQDGEEIYRKHHEIMENFRGREARVAAAEAFVRLGRDSRLPGAESR
ncbi:MAG: PIG-L family deacetylase [Acidobacteria bacterium]|nr:PIG-L family deacetylase [Acidobacteriota bacterium]